MLHKLWLLGVCLLIACTRPSHIDPMTELFHRDMTGRQACERASSTVVTDAFGRRVPEFELALIPTTVDASIACVRVLNRRDTVMITR